jgi:hypothetical protein
MEMEICLNYSQAQLEILSLCIMMMCRLCLGQSRYVIFKTTFLGIKCLLIY